MDQDQIRTGIQRGNNLERALDAILEKALDDVTQRLLDEPNDIAKALAITRALTRVDVHTDGQWSHIRAAAIRRLRYPDGDLTGTPDMGWPEIATAIGLTPGRAQRLSGLPADRSASRPRRSTS